MTEKDEAILKIEKILNEKKPIIDKLIENYLPKKLDKNSIEFLAGRARYDYHIEACQKSLADPIWELLDRGGKRWRPVLFLMIAEALGADVKKLEEFAIVPEIIHEGTLMVDDVEDSSELRRGKPCTYITFGQDIAINAGNAMYYIPLKVFIRNREKFSDSVFARAYEIYIQEMINLSIGQGMDIIWHRGLANADRITEKQYLQMCAYKTGTLARMAAKLAAVLSGADEQKTEKLGRFAEALGVAFQIQDDILDITSCGKEREKFGKACGNDIKEGKRTVMVIYTLQKASEKDRKTLVEILNKHTDDMEERIKAIEIIKKYGAVEYARKLANEMVNESWKEIDGILSESEAKSNLRAFADFCITRSS